MAKSKKSGKEKKAKKKDKSLKTEAAKSSSPPKPEKKSAPKVKKVVAPVVGFASEELSLRAYFIAERRQAMGWPGDSTSDWVEAERQLKTEARKA